MKMDYSQWSICNPNSGQPQAELDGIGDLDGTPASVEPLCSIRVLINFDFHERFYKINICNKIQLIRIK